MEEMKAPDPTPQHQWLQQLVGSWQMEGKAVMPDGGSMESTGSETVSTLGGLWVVCEGESRLPDGTVGFMRMSLGYDPAKQKFTGTWIGSMMNQMWVYEGDLDQTGKVLTLNTEGPGFEEGTIGQYRDIITMADNDHRILTSEAQGKDGTWTQFMRADYYRVK